MDNRFTLRRANVLDADGLSQLYQKTFYETFVEDFSIPYPQNDIEAHYNESGTSKAFENKINDSKYALWLVESKENDEIVAFISVGPCEHLPHEDIVPQEDAQLHRLYVQRDQQNRGFGKQLMDVALPWLEDHYSYRPIWLTVWSNNVRAQRFYEKYGFTKVGDFHYSVGQWKDHEFIMRRQSK